LSTETEIRAEPADDEASHAAEPDVPTCDTAARCRCENCAESQLSEVSAVSQDRWHSQPAKYRNAVNGVHSLCYSCTTTDATIITNISPPPLYRLYLPHSQHHYA